MISKLFDSMERLSSTVSKNTFPEDLDFIHDEDYKKSDFYGFNRQFLKTTIILKLLKALPFDAFVETGTNTGATSFLVAVQTKLPIFTCEVNPGFARLAKRNLWLFKNKIKFFLKDSPTFLSEIFSRKFCQEPFIYLDAHWYDCNPLKKELETIITCLDNYVIVIDDFKIPFDNGFKYDIDNGNAIGIEYIKDILAKSTHTLSLFYPSYKSTQETGQCAGWVLIASEKYALSVNQEVDKDFLIRVNA